MDKVSIFGYCLAVILTLVPTPLLEFRYFITPYYFYRILTYKRGKSFKWKIFMNILVNAIVFWIFLFKSFNHITESGAFRQRFMW